MRWKVHWAVWYMSKSVHLSESIFCQIKHQATQEGKTFEAKYKSVSSLWETVYEKAWHGATRQEIP